MLGVIPGLQVILALATAIWMLVAAVVAIRQALDYQSTGRAVLVVIVGWLAQLALLALVLMFPLAARYRGGPRHGPPTPPNARRAPAKPWRSSIRRPAPRATRAPC